MASFSIPLTGLNADSTALNVIANDLSNMNTTAYKSQSVNFSDLFYQQVGSTGAGNPIQVGAGAEVGSTETDFATGTPTSTGIDTDVALNGNGFFVVSNGDGGYEYSRAGDFSQSANGDLVTSNGLSVMGYPATDGVVDTSAPLTAINIPVGQVDPAKASTTMGMTANLDSTTTAGTEFPAQVTLYDSLGQAQTATVTYTPDAAGGNLWDYSISLPASAYSGAAPAAITGTMQFSSSGVLESITPTGTPTAETVGTGIGDVSSIPLTFSGLADGAANMAINFNLLGSGGTPSIGLSSSASAMSANATNGYPSGEYQSFSIGSDGTVAVTYSNGQTQDVGQLALANVTNLQGLSLLGNGDYATTQASGTASVGVSGTDGLATMEDGALEASNVNISDEFSQLIVAQRAFEANAKSVTTFDTVTQDTINMVH